MSFTTKGHGPIEGSYYGPRQRLTMITEYRQLKKIPNRYRLINTTDDLSQYTTPLTRTVSRRSENRIFLEQLISNLKSDQICRVGAHVFRYNSSKGYFEVFHKVSMI